MHLFWAVQVFRFYGGSRPRPGSLRHWRQSGPCIAGRSLAGAGARRRAYKRMVMQTVDEWCS
ncbi:MAG: hypothetical protein EHM14_01100 [Methanothrix sp.]|nr:MAG: hypothetical protein EHM14_01100 [Methanothrix sp.]